MTADRFKEPFSAATDGRTPPLAGTDTAALATLGDKPTPTVGLSPRVAPADADIPQR